jgi:hypothetical protein
MKTLKFKIIAVLLAIAPIMVNAQTDIDKLYEKYAGKDGITSINISPEMFSFLGAIDMSDSSDDAKDVQEAIDQLSGLKMLVFENDQKKNIESFYDEIKKSIPMEGYSELMSVNDNESDVKFLAKKSGKNRVLELLMLVKSDDEVVVMSMTGNMDMNTISDIGKSLNMKGMENLDKIDKDQK